MPFHDWSDDTFDWNALNSAINYIMKSWMKYGRVGSRGKEKWGSFQDYACFWDGGIHSLIWPHYVYIQNPFLYFKVDHYIVKPFTKYTGIHKLGLWYQYQVYNYVIQTACKRYPHIVDEIVADLDWHELVKPGIFGKVDGTAINKKYWKTYGEEDEHLPC